MTLVQANFGRTPNFPRADGRDHWPNSFSAVLAGGGIKGGQLIGDTGADGESIKERPVTVQEFLATVCQALGIDYQKQNLSNVGRPIRLDATASSRVHPRSPNHFAVRGSIGHKMGKSCHNRRGRTKKRMCGPCRRPGRVTIFAITETKP